MKWMLLSFLLFLGSLAHAGSLETSLKDRVRASLWTQGIKTEKEKKPIPTTAQYPKLPVEIEVPLKNFL